MFSFFTNCDFQQLGSLFQIIYKRRSEFLQQITSEICQTIDSLARVYDKILENFSFKYSHVFIINATIFLFSVRNISYYG